MKIIRKNRFIHGIYGSKTQTICGEICREYKIQGSVEYNIFSTFRFISHTFVIESRQQ